MRTLLFCLSCLTLLSISCSKKDDGQEEEQDSAMKVVFSDSFDNNDHNWTTVNDSVVIAEILDGAFHLRLQKDSFYYFTFTPVAFNTGSRYRINADFRVVELSENSVYGLYWGIHGTKEANFFFLNKNGDNGIGYINNFKENVLQGWYHSNIARINGLNRLSVERDQNVTKYYINDELIFDEEYRILGSRNVGFYISNTTYVTVEYMEVLE